MSRRRDRAPVPARLLIHGLALLTAACATSPPALPAADAPPAAPVRFRAPDGLLRRPVLQRLISAQERRRAGPLVAALSDADPAVRARAALALGSVQDTTAVPALRRVLADSAARVRVDAAFALGQCADSDAAPALLAALASERNLEVRHEIMDALGKIGGAASLPRLLAEVPAAGSGDASALALALARYGLRGIHPAAAVGRLLSGLDASRPRLRLMSAYYFGRSRDTSAWAPHAAAVRAALDRLAPDDPAAMQLVLGLGRLEDPRDTPRLEHWLSAATDWRIAVNAARALATRAAATPGVADSLIAVLGSGGGGRSHSASAAPGRAGRAWTHVAVAAANALSAADSLPPDAVARLARWAHAHPGRWRVTGALMPALARAGHAADVIGWTDAQAEGRAAQKGIAALGLADGATSLTRLFSAASAQDPDVAAAAISALARRWRHGRVRPKTYARSFETALRRQDVAVRVAAAGALADSAFLPFGAVEALRAARASLHWPRDLEAGQAMDAALQRLGAEKEAGVAGDRDGAGVVGGTRRGGAARGALRRQDIDWSRLRRWGPRPRLVLETDQGRITVAIDVDEAPLTALTVLSLAEAGRYDGVPFHRVVPNFVIQGGDFARGDGYGGPGFVIRSEFTTVHYTRGTMGMASAGKDTEGSQYFITHSMQPHLDGKYTAFGQVVSGMGVVDRILEGDRVQHAYVEPDRGGTD